MRSELSIKIYRHPTRGKGSRHQLFTRLTYERKKSEIATKFYLEEKDWNAEKERAIRNGAINSELAEMESRLRAIKVQLEYEDQIVSAKRIKDVYCGKDQVEILLLDAYAAYIEGLPFSSNLALGTITTYKKTYNLLKEYLESENNVFLKAKNVNLKTVEGFNAYMRNVTLKDKRQLKHNTIAKHHSRFRTFLIYCLNHEYLDKNPYNFFKLTFKESERIFLTAEELESFETCDLGGNQSLERVRDTFIFSVYLGMRFGDAQKLQMKDLIKSNGKLYFSHKEQKTGKHAQLPILPKAKAIIEKYADTPERSFGKVLPKISNQKCNAYLKVIAELANITDKEVSHHVARHTCATTVLLENGVPIEIVQAWLNHSNIRETMIYAKMTSRAVNQNVSVEALFEKFNVRPSEPI